MEFPLDLASRWGGKRYNSFNRVLKNSFNARVYKVGLRMDFTCPNRDGKVAVGARTYCNNFSHWQGRLYTARLGVSRRACPERSRRADAWDEEIQA